MSLATCVCCRKRPVDPKWRPFCSERCKIFDLANWATGQYRAPGEPVEDAREDDDEDDKS